MNPRHGFIALLAAFGCSSEGTPGPPPSETPPGELLAAPDPNLGVQLELGVDVPPGTEGTWCRHIVLPAESHDLTRYQSKFTPISHHLIVYQTTLSANDASVELEPFDCDARDRFRNIAGFHYGSQVSEDTIAFPPGIGKRQLSNEVVLIEYHAINVTSELVRATARVNLWYAEKPIETVADTLFFYHPIIFVPAHGSAVASMRCKIENDVLLMHALPHMHRRGVELRATLLDSGGALIGPLLETSTAEPGTTSFNPLFEVRAGQAIEFTCRYQNDDGIEAVEGPSAVRNEMCTFAANFYSPRGEIVDGPTRLCEGPGSGPRMAGSNDCRATIACVDRLRARDASDPETQIEGERCWNAACQSAYETSQAFLGCRWEHCSTECVTSPDQPLCDACVSAHCRDANDSCVANSCG